MCVFIIYLPYCIKIANDVLVNKRILRVHQIDFKFSVILITGGGPPDKVGKSVELLHPNGTHMCELEALPDRRVGHTQSGLIACGGEGLASFSCVIFANGAWQRHSSLKQSFAYHTVWYNGTATLLIGGEGRQKMELVSTDRDHRYPWQIPSHFPSTNLTHPAM